MVILSLSLDHTLQCALRVNCTDCPRTRLFRRFESTAQRFNTYRLKMIYPMFAQTATKTRCCDFVNRLLAVLLCGKTKNINTEKGQTSTHLYFKPHKFNEIDAANTRI